YAVASGYPLLRPAFVLPLEWREGGVHDPGLPSKLHELANRVLSHLQLNSWSLHRLPPFREVDLAALNTHLEHESGWAPLIGSLWIAQQGGKPQPTVWATGCWEDNGGVQEV